MNTEEWYTRVLAVRDMTAGYPMAVRLGIVELAWHLLACEERDAAPESFGAVQARQTEHLTRMRDIVRDFQPSDRQAPTTPAAVAAHLTTMLQRARATPSDPDVFMEGLSALVADFRVNPESRH